MLVVCAAPALTQGAEPDFARVLPEGVADVTGWEVVTGEFETATMRGAYQFHVNPSRAAMYQLMRYRVEIVPANASTRKRRSAERVAFVRRPGVREPIACWERQAPGAVPAWRRIGEGTDEHKIEMVILMQVLAVHGRARREQAPR